MKEKFEDILKQRLQLEEHVYDPSGWDAYQREYGNNAKVKPFFKLKRLLVFISLFIVTLSFSLWYTNDYFSQPNDIIVSELMRNKESNVAKQELTNVEDDSSNSLAQEENKKENIQNRVNNIVATNESSDVKADVTLNSSKTNTLANQLVNNKNTTTINNNNNNRKIKISNFVNSKSVSNIVNNDSFNATTEDIKFKTQNVLKNTDNKNEVLGKSAFQGSNLGLGTFNKKESPEQLYVTKPDGISDSKNEFIPIDSDIISSVSKLKSKSLFAELKYLPSLDFSINTANNPIQIEGDFIKVLGKPRMNFYIGAGYVTTFKQRSVEDEVLPFDPSILKVGIDYNLSHNTSLTFELNVNYQQYLNMSKDLNFYNQTATNFWYFEIEALHRSHVNLELPVLFNYHVLNDRVRLYGGASLSYTIYREVNARLNTNLTYDQIEAFGLPHFADDSANYERFVNPINASLIFGVRVPIFKWLHVDARFNKGILDISNDSFWDAGIDTNDYFNISTHINF
jgi:hypothetical protein